MPPRVKQVTVLYGEPKLQTTFAVLNRTPPDGAKKAGEEEMRKHLNKLEEEGIVPHLELDPECTDFFPDPSPSVPTVGDLNGNIAMIVWPAADPNTMLTPSPVVDTFVKTAFELRDVRSKQAIESLINDPTTSTHSKKGKKRNKGKAKQLIQPTSDNSEQPSDELTLKALMSRISALETDSHRMELESRQTEVELRRIPALEAELRRIPALEAELHRVEREMTKLREEVLVDRATINKIRQRILLDLGRDKLATFCGFQDWEGWKKKADRETMATLAKTTVLSDPTVPEAWKDLARHPNAFDFIVTPNSIRLQGNVAAHKSDESVIAESIFSLPEFSQNRSLMTIIFTTYYGHPPVVEGLSI